MGWGRLPAGATRRPSVYTRRRSLGSQGLAISLLLSPSAGLCSAGGRAAPLALCSCAEPSASASVLLMLPAHCHSAGSGRYTSVLQRD